MSRRRKGLHAQMRGWNHASREIAAEARRATEGEPGIATVFGRRFETRVFRSVATANDFMERNPGWGVLREQGARIHVARKDDNGT